MILERVGMRVNSLCAERARVSWCAG